MSEIIDLLRQKLAEVRKLPLTDTERGSKITALIEEIKIEERKAIAVVEVVVAEVPITKKAATEYKQDVGNTSLLNIDTKITNKSTEAKQDVGNASLASIDDKIVENQPDLWQILTREGKGFIAATGFTTINVLTEVDFMLLRNPVSSGVLVRFKEFLFTIKANSGQSSLIRFYIAPTITNAGTPLTVRKVLSTGIPTSQILAYQQPTISNRGTFAQVFNIGIETYQREQGLARYLTEGSDVLITVQGVIANIEHNITTSWAEEPLIV